jgi:hypothetical protein
MVVVEDRIDGWWNDSFTPKSDSPREFQSFGPQPLWQLRGAHKKRLGELLLDNAFSLIEGHPGASSSLRVRPPN